MGNSFLTKNKIADRIVRAYWYALAMIVRACVRVRHGQVMCWAYSFRQYGCNPKYITEYILANCPEDFSIVWAFKRNVDVSVVSGRVKTVRVPSIMYLYYLYTSEFIITNSRNKRYYSCFKKKNGQKYIMCWHGSLPLKKIEKDSEHPLEQVYVRDAKDDSRMCDIMLSGNKFFTDILHRAFWYDGKVLECGEPRHDIYFEKGRHQQLRREILGKLNVPDTTKIVMYAPTFRNYGSDFSHYDLDWNRITPLLGQALKSEVVVFVRLHPNIIEQVDVDEKLNNPDLRNMCFYHDMQELMCVTDILITDYSSTMFEAALLGRLCLLYADDIEDYDRGFYFRLSDLPFPLATTKQQLEYNIEHMDRTAQLERQFRFLRDTMKVMENGMASKEVVRWMKRNTNQY